MGKAQESLSVSELERIARDLLTDPKGGARGGKFSANCPFHSENTPGGAFWYRPEEDSCYSTEYIDDQDLIGEFISRCCDRGEDLETQAKQLYLAFRMFCLQEKELSEKYIRALKPFMADLRQKGFETRRTNYVFIRGLAVKESWQGVNGGEES